MIRLLAGLSISLQTACVEQIPLDELQASPDSCAENADCPPGELCWIDWRCTECSRLPGPGCAGGNVVLVTFGNECWYPTCVCPAGTSSMDGACKAECSSSTQCNCPASPAGAICRPDGTCCEPKTTCTESDCGLTADGCGCSLMCPTCLGDVYIDGSGEEHWTGSVWIHDGGKTRHVGPLGIGR